MFFIILIFSSISTLILGLILWYPTRRLFSNTHANTIRWGLATLFGFSFTWFYLFTSPAYNHQTAELRSEVDTYRLILTGKRVPLKHDLISILSRTTYSDTVELILPRNKGLIKGNEIPYKSGYQMDGTIYFSANGVIVNLVYLNTDDHVSDPFSYNGTYQLKK